MNQPIALFTGDRPLEIIKKLLRGVSSHPDAIEVSLQEGHAILKGAALENEVDQIEAAVRSVPGISSIQNQLSLLDHSQERDAELFPQPHSETLLTDIPGSLSYGMRLVLGLSGASMIYYGIRRKDLGGVFFVGFGLGAIIRALSSLDTARLFELLLHPRISLEREIIIDAPVEVVYDFWSHFENYSRFMSYVREVKLNNQQGFTWTVVGPAGLSVRWDSKIRMMIPCQLFSWESSPHALIQNSGQILFKSHRNGKSTRLTVQLSYAPPGGAVGWEVIRILGFDPRSRMDTDLLLMKTLIESKFK